MDFEKILETFTLEEIIEYNDASKADVLEELINEWGFRIPLIPVDAYEKAQDGNRSPY